MWEVIMSVTVLLLAGALVLTNLQLHFMREEIESQRKALVIIASMVRSVADGDSYKVAEWFDRAGK